LSALRALAAMLASLALTACTAPTSYMGISFAPGAAASDLQDLARRAQAGDKQAQLDLGITYEEGRGVAVDLEWAARLYRVAATDSGGLTWATIPGGKRGRAAVYSFQSGPRITGLKDAKRRLDSLGSDSR
jgi:hypothetical protein